MDWVKAIESRRLVSFHYHNHPRVVIPAAYGSHVTTGNVVLRAYQIRGSGKTRAVPFWDLFLVDEVVNPTMLDEIFADDPPYYRRDDKHMSVIYAQL